MMKTVLRNILYADFMHPLWDLLDSAYGAILMFHRIAPLDTGKLRYNDHLKVTPEYFEKLLLDFKQDGFTFLSMDELAELIRKRKKYKKILLLTFDDGYQDNLDCAYPILKYHKVPATIYLATGLLTEESLLWWNILEDFLLHNNSCILPDGQNLQCKTPQEKEDVFLRLRTLILSIPPENQEKELKKIFNGQLTQDFRDHNQLMITGEQLLLFSSNPFITFGCHTHSHISCGKLPYSIIKDDILKSLRFLQKYHIRPVHFAYPYGDDIQKDNNPAELLQEHSFKTAVTTFSGFLTVETMKFPFFLPRIFVSQYDNFSVRQNFQNMRIAGKISSLRNREIHR